MWALLCQPIEVVGRGETLNSPDQRLIQAAAMSLCPSWKLVDCVMGFRKYTDLCALGLSLLSLWRQRSFFIVQQVDERRYFTWSLCSLLLSVFLCACLMGSRGTGVNGHAGKGMRNQSAQPREPDGLTVFEIMTGLPRIVPQPRMWKACWQPELSETLIIAGKYKRVPNLQTTHDTMAPSRVDICLKTDQSSDNLWQGIFRCLWYKVYDHCLRFQQQATREIPL